MIVNGDGLDLLDYNASITLSIVSHGQGHMVRNLLCDLAAQRGVVFNIVLTINISEDESFLGEFQDMSLRVIRNKSMKGFGANHNAAFELCKSKWFVVLNPDIRLSTQLTLYDLLFDGKMESLQAALVAPLIVNPFGGIEDSVRSNITPWSIITRKFGFRKKLIKQGRGDGGKQFIWFAGMVLALRADIYRSVGGFNERFFMYCEDYDLCARIYRQGHDMFFNGRSVFVHDAQRGSHHSVKHFRWHLISLIKVWFSSVYWYIILKSI